MARTPSTKPALAALALSALVAAAPAAFGRCELAIKSLGSVVLHASRGNDYDPFDAGQYVVVEEFELEHDADACAFFVTFSADASGNYNRTMRHNGAALRYQIYDSVNLHNVLKDLPQASAHEVIAGSFGKGKQRRRLQFAIAVPAHQFVPRGHYDDRITLSAYEGTLGSNARRDSRSIRISTRIRSAIQVSLVPSGGAFDPARRRHSLDFGTLAEGKSEQVDLLVRNNTAYKIIFESEHRGALRHVAPREGDAIRYEMRVRGVPVRLSEGRSEFPGGGGISQFQGERYPISITIGSLEHASAGRYQDHITITVKAD